MFYVQLSGFHRLEAHTAPTDSISALMLPTNSNVDSSQRVPILARVRSSANFVNLTDSTDNTLQLVKYESIAIVLRHCDSQRSIEMHDRIVTIRTTPTSVNRNSDHRKPQERRYSRMTRKQVVHAKNTLSFKRRGRYGHRFGDHQDDGTLRSDVANSPTPILDLRNTKPATVHTHTNNSNNDNNLLRCNNTVTCI